MDKFKGVLFLDNKKIGNIEMDELPKPVKPISFTGVDESNGRERTCVIRAFRKDGVIKITGTTTFKPPINYAGAAYYKAVSRPLYRQHGRAVLQQLPQDAYWIMRRLIDQKPDYLQVRACMTVAIDNPKIMQRNKLLLSTPKHILHAWRMNFLNKRNMLDDY